ncbi:MAG: TonB-dependent receptor [Alistipes sp.]|nr:TonB-dependent receptor [Alistipes sp.]
MKKLTFILLAIFGGITFASSQNVIGKVLDAQGKPLPGASVYWADTSVGVATDLEGKFTLYRVKDNNALVATFLGYTNDTIRVEQKMREVEFRLAEGVVVDAVVVEGGLGNYIRQDGLLKSENISFAGLCKMACCNLAESFENSASVTVGFSDAISGARQIKMLGLAGTYTQILDENRTIMRGLSAPYGLSYTPGMWLSSIQVSKGISSVTAGHEAITGQINLEHRKPTDEERFFLNLFLDSHLKPEFNLSSAIPVTKDKRLSTVILAHGAYGTMNHDGNKDGYRDTPLARTGSVANRWLWQGKNGEQVRWGVKYLYDHRIGGQMGYNTKMHKDSYFDNGVSWRENWHTKKIYGSEVENQEAGAYFKIGMPVGEAVYDKENNEELRSNIAIVVDYDFFNESSYFGADKEYFGRQHMTTANAMYAHYFTPRSSLISGISASSRWVKERLFDWVGGATPTNLLTPNRNESEVGAYTEYTFNLKDKLSVVAGIRYDYAFYFRKHLITPRAHVKWNITPTTILRGSVGLGHRPTDIITDNIGVLATGRAVKVEMDSRDRMEKALTAGGSLSQSFSTFAPNDLTISVDYFYTRLFNTVIVDQERDASNIYIYEMGGMSRTHTAQIDITWTPIKRFDIFATFRYTDSRYTINHNGAPMLVERPLVGRYKALINLQYATNMRKWVFDLTAQLNGPARIPTQTGDMSDSHLSNGGKPYPMLFAQVSRRIKKWEIYLGCENIIGFKQKEPIIMADDPYSTAFNSSLVWGPLTGQKVYVGVRFNLY